jgi:eukaryotic-like serine/threonine-protein kinase
MILTQPSTRRNLKISLGLFVLLALTGIRCQKHNSPPSNTYAPTLVSFVFRQQDNHFLYGVDSAGVFLNDTTLVSFFLPGGTNIKSLIPTISFVGEIISPQSGSAQDFTNAVIYTITAINGAKKYFKVQIQFTYANEVVVGSSDHSIYSFDATTGKTRWTFQTGQPVVSAPIFITDYSSAFIGSSDYNFYCLDLTTGSKNWVTSTSGAITSRALYTGETGAGILIGSWDQFLYDINPYSGGLLWKGAISSPIQAAPYYEGNGYLYVSGQAGEVYNFFLYYADDIIDSFNLGGTLSSAIDAAPMYSTFYYGNEPALFYSNGDSSVHARIYGWNYQINNVPFWTFKTGGPVLSSPTVAQGVVYAGSTDKMMYALNDTTGSLIWSFPTGGSIQSKALVTGGIVYFGSDDGKVYALNAQTGSLVWSAQTGGPVRATAVVAKGTLYIGSQDYSLYAFSASNGTPVWTAATRGPILGAAAVIGKDSTVYY